METFQFQKSNPIDSRRLVAYEDNARQFISRRERYQRASDVKWQRGQPIEIASRSASVQIAHLVEHRWQSNIESAQALAARQPADRQSLA